MHAEQNTNFGEGVKRFGMGAGKWSCEPTCLRGGDLSQGTCRSLNDTLDSGAMTGLNIKGSYLKITRGGC